MNFQLLVKPVADFLGVPEDESQIFEVNKKELTIEIE
jgi:hypothetical protein